jgi:hypothetical protein
LGEPKHPDEYLVMITRLATFLLAPLILLLTGCVDTELHISNQTGTGIHVYSGQTKKITTIQVGATGVVPHTSGKIIIITEKDEIWEYMDVRTVVDEASKRYKRVSSEVRLGPDGVMTLPSGKNLKPKPISKERQ